MPSRDELDLFDYQLEEMIPYLLGEGKGDDWSCALWAGLGLGKTVSVLTAIRMLLDTSAIERVLVIAPIRVALQTWPAELAAWDHLKDISYTIIRADDKAKSTIQRAAEARRLLRDAGYPPDVATWLGNKVKTADLELQRRVLVAQPTTIHIINREAVEWLVGYWGRRWPYDMVVYDEASGLKDHRTKRFKALVKVRKKIKRFIELTATPAPEGYFGLFSQVFLLDQGERFGRAITPWREKYFDFNQWSKVTSLKDGAARVIEEKVADIALVMKAEDYLSVHQPMIQIRPVTLSETEMDRYKEFEKEFILDLPDGTEIEALTAANLSQKLLQLASGAVYETLEGGGRRTHFVHDHKVEELKEIVEEALGAPVCVAYWFKSSLERLKAEFPDARVMDIDGKLANEWNAGKLPIMLIHPQSAGHGLNLQFGGHLLVFFDLPWSLELFLQTIGRFVRPGQEHVVRAFLLAAVGTADFLVAEARREKQSGQDRLLRRVRELYEEAHGKTAGPSTSGRATADAAQGSGCGSQGVAADEADEL